MKHNVFYNLTLFLFVAVVTLVASHANAQEFVEKRITFDPQIQSNPVIDGDAVVWTDQRNNNLDIYFRTINSDGTLGEEKQVTNHSGVQESPAISGNIIAWHDSRNGNWSVYFRTINPDGTLEGEKQVTNHSADQMDPAISGNAIVWQDERNGNWDIYLRTINSDGTLGEEKQVTTDSFNQTDPAISGNAIVWEDYRNGNGNADIYFRTINPGGILGEEKQVTNDSAEQWSPAINGNTVVWMDHRNGNGDIYAGIPADTTPIYRFHSQKYNTHFYTNSEDEKNHIIKTYPPREWLYEGIAYNAYGTPTQHTHPIYRFFSLTYRKHFYTISEQEKNIILNNTYPEAKFQYEGIAWYADNTPTSATTPIYRFHSQKYNAHFFTMSDTEKDHIIKTYPQTEWTYEGIAWYGVR